AARGRRPPSADLARHRADLHVPAGAALPGRGGGRNRLLARAAVASLARRRGGAREWRAAALAGARARARGARTPRVRRAVCAAVAVLARLRAGGEERRLLLPAVRAPAQAADYGPVVAEADGAVLRPDHRAGACLRRN